MMKWGWRVFTGLLAVVAAWLLFTFLLRGESAERPVTLLVLAVASLAWFARPASLLSLVVVFPVGAILDSPVLAPGRTIYATEVILLAAVVAIGVRWAVLGRGEYGNRSSFPLPAGLWAGFALAGILTLVAGHSEMLGTPAGLRGLRVLFLALAVSFLLWGLGRDAVIRSRAWLLWTAVAVIGLGLLGLGGILEFLLAVIRGGGDRSPGSFYRSSVGLAAHIAFLSPLAVSLCLSRAGRSWRIGGGVAWLLALICMPLTASRGAMGSVLLTTVFLILVTARQWSSVQRRGVWIVFVVMAAGFTLLAISPDIAGESFAYKFRKTVEGDFFSTRVDGWQEGMAAIAGNPLIGEGPNAWAPSMPLELARRHGVPAAILALVAIVLAGIRVGKWAGRSARGRAGSSDQLVRAVGLGLSAGFGGLLLVGLAETGLGARLTPLVTSAILVAGFLQDTNGPTPVDQVDGP